MGCNEKKPKKEFVRIVKNKDGEIFIDRTGKADDIALAIDKE